MWNDLFGGFDAMNRRFEEMFSRMTGPDVKTYGYTMYQGPDGVRHVREFGNTDGRPFLQAPSKDIFTDVATHGDSVVVTAELPGVPREDISITYRNGALNISAKTPGKEFSKDVALPCEVEPKSAKATYNNGVLEVVMDSKSKEEEGYTISLE